MKLVLCFSRKFEAADETMVKAQRQFREVKMDFKTRNSSKKKLHTYSTNVFYHTNTYNICVCGIYILYRSLALAWKKCV